MYHKIDANCDPDLTPWSDPGLVTSQWVTVRNFRHQMFLMHDLGYQTVTYEDVRNHINDIKELPPKPVIISFDDGYQNVYTYALPVMQEFTAPDFHGVMQITTDVTGDNDSTRQQNTWDQPTEPPAWHTIWPEVRSLYDAGWSIEAHSRAHRHTWAADYDLVYEAGSAAVIASKINIPAPKFYVYPYGENVDTTVLNTAGYFGGVDADGGIENTGTTNLWHIKRIAVYRGADIDRFASYINESVPDEANNPRLTLRIWYHRGRGTIIPTPDRPYYAKNSVVNLVAVPDAGYHFIDWTGSAVNAGRVANTASPATTVTMAGSYDVFANFEINPYSVTVATVGHGSVAKNPDKPAYLWGEQITLTAIPTNDSVFSGWSSAMQGSSNPAILTVTGDQTVTATFTPLDVNLPIHVNVWYGNYQIFGQKGIPQRWANILGNVTNADTVASLQYSLNGGPLSPLSIGVQNPRLASRGDFNVEIACTDLRTDANNIVQIVATDIAGKTTAATVVCKYIDTTVWPLPYTANWSAATAISDAAQIVDGRWALGANGVSTVVQGYDRSIAIGDMDYWHDYEVTVPVTVHQSYHDAGQSGDEPAIGLAMRWAGHTQWGSDQPTLGYYPAGAFVFFNWLTASGGEYRLYDHTYEIVAQNSSLGPPQNETTYLYKMRVETRAGVGGLYNFKVWQSGQPEPSQWLMTRQESLADPQYGSVLLIAHHVDATFGNVTITPAAPSTFTISGSTGIDGVTMNGLPGNPVSSGGGSYSVVVPYGWGGTVTPAKTGYTFTPANKVYTNITTDQPSQNYTAAQSTFTISGSTGIDGVTMNGLPGNPVSDSQGAYSATVPYGWGGMVKPTKTGYKFTPTSRSYSNVTANKLNQNYTATQITYTISGNAGTGGVTMNGLPGNPVTGSKGAYSASIPYGWSGTVTPAKTGYKFTPTSRSYTNVTANKSGQNYTAQRAP